MSILKKLYTRIICSRTYCIMLLVVLTALTSSPLIQNHLGRFVKIGFAWGAFLIVRDMLQSRSMIKNRSSLWLLLFCLSYAFSILIAAPARLTENVIQLLYMGLFMVLLFGNDLDSPVEEKKKELLRVGNTFIAVIFALTLCCIILFMFSIGFEYRHNGETFIVGMSFNRFWGLYNPNTGAALAVTSIFLCWMLLVMGQKRGRCFYITNIVFQMFYLLLTQSRTAWYTLLIFGGIILFVQFLLRLRQKGKDTKGRVAALLAAVLVAAGGVELLRPVSVAAVSYIPSVITQVKSFIFENGRFSSEDLHPAISERDDSFGSDNTDATNGRVMLWKAGLKAFLKKPVFGVTREALYDEVSPYLAEERMGNLKRGGLHNIYLSVLVCSGLVGFTLLLIFVLGLCRTLLFRRSLVVSRENLWQYLLMVIPFSFFLMELFEARILYRANIFGVVFWLFTGYMMYFAEKDAEKAGGGFRSNWVARLERAVCRLKGKR